MITWAAIKLFFGDLLRSIPWQAWVVVGVLAALYFGYRMVDNAAYKRGHSEATTKIEEANREADRKADAGEDDVARCYKSGGKWVRTSGACEPPLRSN